MGQKLTSEGRKAALARLAGWSEVKDRDAITACFDEEGQYMLEGSSEPTVGVAFSPQEPEEVKQTLRIVGRFVDLNCELFQLAEELQEWEKRHADKRLDRGEPSLRAA